jgi:hypothetical protein
MMMTKKVLYQNNVRNPYSEPMNNKSFFVILAPYSSNMFQQQPQNFYPEQATPPSTTTIPPGIYYLNDSYLILSSI